jgi:hypothetical protein
VVLSVVYLHRERVQFCNSEDLRDIRTSRTYESACSSNRLRNVDRCLRKHTVREISFEGEDLMKKNHTCIESCKLQLKKSRNLHTHLAAERIQMFIKGLRIFSTVIMITSGLALLTSKLVLSQSQCSVRFLSTSLQSSSSSDSCNLIVKDAGSRVVNGNYIAKDPKVLPKGFIKYEPCISIICDHLIRIFLFNLE